MKVQYSVSFLQQKVRRKLLQPLKSGSNREVRSHYSTLSKFCQRNVEFLCRFVNWSKKTIIYNLWKSKKCCRSEPVIKLGDWLTNWQTDWLTNWLTDPSLQNQVGGKRESPDCSHSQLSNSPRFFDIIRRRNCQTRLDFSIKSERVRPKTRIAFLVDPSFSSKCASSKPRFKRSHWSRIFYTGTSHPIIFNSFFSSFFVNSFLQLCVACYPFVCKYVSKITYGNKGYSETFCACEKKSFFRVRPRCCYALMHLTSLRRNCGHIDPHGYH
jgi:hypothetical protein